MDCVSREAQSIFYSGEKKDEKKKTRHTRQKKCKPHSNSRLCLMAKWKIIWAMNPIRARKKRRPIGVTATSTRLSRRRCARRKLSDIENKVLAMYVRGMSQRDISSTIDDIYGFKLSAEQISKITDYVLEEQENWQNRRLAPFYPFLFVDCLFVPIKRDYETKKTVRANMPGCKYSTS